MWRLRWAPSLLKSHTPCGCTLPFAGAAFALGYGCEDEEALRQVQRYKAVTWGILQLS